MFENGKPQYTTLRDGGPSHDKWIRFNHVLNKAGSVVAPHTNDEVVGGDSNWCRMYKYFLVHCKELIFPGIVPVSALDNRQPLILVTRDLGGIP